MLALQHYLELDFNVALNSDFMFKIDVAVEPM